jgi:hypothetical protein
VMTNMLPSELRDYFAAAALPAVLAAADKLRGQCSEEVIINGSAATAYMIADAMLAERVKPPLAPDEHTR